MNNYQAKVNNTQQYSDSQGKHIVCKGKLVLLPFGPVTSGTIQINGKGRAYNPIIISETETLELD